MRMFTAMVRSAGSTNVRRFFIVILTCLTLPCSAQDSVRFEGLSQLSVEQAREILKHQIAYLSDHGVSPARADDAAYFLTIGMHRLGFEDAQVDWEIENGIVVLNVVESARLALGEVRIEGNDAIESDVLSALLQEETRSRLKGILKAEELPYVEADIQRGVESIRALYANLGYYDAEANASITRTLEGNSMRIELSVKEGPLYRISSVSVELGPQELTEELEALIIEFEATPFTPSSAEVLKGRILELHHDEGYSGAEIARLEPTLGNVNASNEVPVALVVQVESGAKRILRNISVSGNNKVKDTFFLRRFEKLQGQPYDEGQANRIVRRMLRSGAFSKVELQESPDGQSNALDLMIAVQETPAREIGVYGGFGSWEGYIIGGTFQHYNLLGAVRRLDSRIELTGRGISGDINVFEPWALGDRTTVSGGLYARRRDNDGYTKFEIGAHLELTYDLSEHARLSLFSRTAFTDILEHHVVDEALGDDSYLSHSVGVGFTYDKRDSPTLPTDGHIFNVSADVASGVIGSEVDFVRGVCRFTYYKALGPVRVHAGVRAGVIVPIGDTEQLPIDVRHFSGGASTIRSFPEREAGPQDRRGNPIGGQFYTTFNAEASVPIWKELRLAGFVDSGNLLGDYDAISFDDMHHAAGAGLRYDLPVGPIRLDYGWNLNRGNDEPEGAFHFGIGMSF